MKKLILAAMLIIGSNLVSAQTVKMDAKGNFFAVSKHKIETKDSVNTGKTYTDSKGNVYPVYSSSKGSLFVGRTSQKTGNYYRMYLRKVALR